MNHLKWLSNDESTPHCKRTHTKRRHSGDNSADEMAKPAVDPLPKPRKVARTHSHPPVAAASPSVTEETDSTISIDSPQAPLTSEMLQDVDSEQFLRIAEKHTTEEIARVLGSKQASVRTRINRCIPRVAVSQGKPEAEVRAQFNERRHASGALSQRGYANAQLQAASSQASVDRQGALMAVSARNIAGASQNILHFP